MPLFKYDKKLLEKILKAIKKQDFDGKIEIIKIDKGFGLARSLNYGIKEAKYDVIVSLHQDCLPSSNKWLVTLTNPLLEKKVVASVSKVELPYQFWKGFSFFARVFSAKEQKIIKPLMDEKGCAYKKSVLIRVGLFNEKDFRTAGEDFDMYIKLKKIGKIAYPDCKVLHFHKHTFKNRFKKELQLSNGFGALVGIYGREMPKSAMGLIKSIPILGLPLFIINFPYKRWFLGGLCWIILCPIIHLVYCYGFWKGFLNNKQII